MDIRAARVAGRAPFAALAGVLPDQLFLLRIHADHRPAGGQGGRDLVVYVPELAVPVRALLSFQRLGVALQAVLQRPGQQLADTVMGNLMPLAPQLSLCNPYPPMWRPSER